MIQITPRLAISDTDIEERFIAASGPGGQNVNKVATAVQLRFNLMACENLNEAVKARLAKLSGRRLGQDGWLLISASRFRTQNRNREDAREKLAVLIREALIAPRLRKATRPTKASKTRRLDAKNHRATTKKLRGKGCDSL